MATSNAFAQTGEHYLTYGSRVIEGELTSSVTGDPYYAYSDSLGQTIFVSETTLHSIRVSVIDPKSTSNIPGMLTLYKDSAYGEIVGTWEILISGLNRIFPAEELEGLSESEVNAKAFEYTMNATVYQSYAFEDVMTEYVLDVPLEPGYYAFVISTDPTVIHQYPGGGEHAPQISSLINYYPTNDPYQFGHALVGGCVGEGGDWLDTPIAMDPGGSGSFLGIDMAFEFTTVDLSTSIHPISQYVRGNTLSVPESWNGARVETLDMSGRLVWNTRVRTGDMLRFPEDQILIVRAILSDGTFQSEQVSTVGF